ncbi:uncharacterized protein K452DRAFT_221727 [Aplosporella prunicola CBS 121167]|uniref:Deacetylase complex subunit Sds3 n=1 Tax=Aplosporella prunicola CBS 121167 TaxID=1176127 RepID=A0A6A6BRK5_9PEZI|nr:uncharacterized protein K452DRAFT_221727 [Aplosporella prunicola CBS 121167]KAF2145211.1 hypothetical protein K452DRAFT_221727 [Aplosporella prunicola CBS 121167]
MARARSLSPPADIPLGHSATSPPPLLPLSKRDKRRTMLSDKLGDMVAGFSDNRDQHYRAQIQAVQADMALIMRADPYQNKPLDDSGDDVNDTIQATTGAHQPQPGTASSDYVAQVGRFHSRFVEEVNNAMEDRDVALTMLFNKHQSSLSELNQSHQYKVKLAQEEHKHLANTLRERLIASIKQRQARLLKEKEQLDIADSNALLLHPNQFSITNPASPGGPQANRKTRHTRHRVGDADDMVGSAMADKSRKRKHFEDADSGSPGPSGRNADLGFASPFRDAKAKTMHTQFEAPAYSIDRLFTDKELAMTMNTAAVATTHFFNKLRVQEQQQQQFGSSANGTNGTNANLDGGNDSGSATANEGDADADDDVAMPAAPEMERTQSHHATRGSTRNNPLADLALAAERTSLPFAGVAPVIIPANIGSKANASAPTPPGLANAEVDADFAIMSRPADGSDELQERLLNTACAPLQTREFQYQPSGSSGGGGGGPGGTGARGDSHHPTHHAHTNGLLSLPPHVDFSAAAAGGSAAMSRQGSQTGLSDGGGGAGSVPMSRHGNGSSVGGTGMRRTASGFGRGKGRVA